jgi:outer membrane protein assembly factor BamB
MTTSRHRFVSPGSASRRRSQRLVRSAPLLALLGCALAAPALWGSRAAAVGTRSFEIDSAAHFAAGELEGTTVLSHGSLAVGREVRRVAVENTPLVYSMARAADGSVYLGTGNDGRILRLRGDRLEEVAATGQLLVASLALDTDGTLYAGTLPEGRIFAVAPDGAMRELARLEEAEHVWALVMHGNALLAATGPHGRVYSVDRRGHAEVYFQSNASHVMSLARDADGAVYAGTSDDALLLRLLGPGRAEVVFDFPGDEVTAIAARNGTLAVAVNEFPAPPRVGAATDGIPNRPGAGKGRLYVVSPEGRSERVYAQDDGHFTSVQLDADGTVYAGVGKDGRVLRVAADRTSSVLVDVEERQVLAIDMLGADPVVVTGDSGAVYHVTDRPAATPVWTSRVLDASFNARFGQLDWRGQGGVRFMTRTGNSSEADETWSAWSAAISAPGPVRSPGARYIQVRAELTAPTSAVHAITVHYLPQNQRAAVLDISLKARPASRGASSRYELEWQVDNPDSDALRYRLRFRAEDQTVWRDMFREDVVHTDANYAWETAALPDGYYIVEVEASDEPANPRELRLTSRAVSEPIRVDNHAPVIEQLQLQGARVSGRAVDTLGPVARLELAVDGGPFRDIFPVDHLLDTAVERFEVDLTDLEPGTHVVAVRATDASGNAVTAEVEHSARR